MLTELTWNESNCPDSIGDWGRRVMSYVKSERVKFAVDCDLLHRNLEPTAKAHKRIAMVMEYSMKDIFKQPYSYMSIDRMRGSIYGPEWLLREGSRPSKDHWDTQYPYTTQTQILSTTT